MANLNEPSSILEIIDAINGKQEKLVSGTNIKSINNESILGSGNITISGGSGVTDVKVDNTSVVSGGVANIDLTGYAQKSGAVFSGDVYAESLYQKSTSNPNQYVKSLTPETVDTYSAKRDLSNLTTTSSTNFDGQWVAKVKDDFTVSTSTTTVPQEFNLKTLNYLPNDNNKYEVLIYLYIAASSSSTTSAVAVSSDIVSGNNVFAQHNLAKYAFMNFAIPVNNTLKVQVTQQAVGNITLSALGYRRIGTNS